MANIIIDFLDTRLKPYMVVMLAASITAFLGAMNYLAGSNSSFLVLYLIPILMVVWIAGRWVGILFTVFCTAAWFIADVLAAPFHPQSFYENPFIISWNVTMQMGVFLIVIYLVSALKEALLREKSSARTDFLTGVANIRHFSEVAAIELSRAHRYKHPLTMAYLDVDNFKTVNDRLGHKTGDVLLQQVAKTIRTNLRDVDLVARVGGDEFVIFMPETKLEQAKPVIDRIQKVFLDIVKKNRWPVTFSAGVVGYDNPPRTINEVIKSADGLMYSAKERGKNAVLYEKLPGRE